MSGVLRIATRRSALAMWQAEHVRDRLTETHPGLEVELVPIVTRGDQFLDRPLAEIGGKGLFLKELEQAMLEGDADLAVNSMKDMPAEMTPGLSLAVSLPRANPFDAWLSRTGDTLETLPAGSRVGTSSLRRQCQLAAARPDLQVVSLRGNVDTRLRKLQDGEYDAIILACAGLERLGLGQHITQELGPPTWLPAATQGIIGLECRTGDERTLSLIEPLADAEATVQAAAERAVARVLEGSCQVPLAAHAVVDGDTVRVEALVGDPAAERVVRAAGNGPAVDAEAVGEAVARDLLAQGAADIIRSLTDAG
ncbi:MAG: hydroxymethylbilane synthase [Gammaproteobacteria bacterium]